MIDTDSRFIRVPANLEKLQIGDKVIFRHGKREAMVTGCERSGKLGFADRKQEWLLTVAYFTTGGECRTTTLPVECFEAIIPNPNYVSDEEADEPPPRKMKTRGGFAAARRVMDVEEEDEEG